MLLYQKTQIKKTKAIHQQHAETLPTSLGLVLEVKAVHRQG